MFAVSQRSPKALLTAAIACVALGVTAMPAAARYDSPHPRSHTVAIPVNAPGTDVAAPDQQSPKVVVNARGTDVTAPDQQSPIADVASRPAPVSPAPDDGSLPTVALVAMIALGLGGLGVAARLATSRRRTRATA
jgi:hypothetical protein